MPLLFSLFFLILNDTVFALLATRTEVSDLYNFLFFVFFLSFIAAGALRHSLQDRLSKGSSGKSRDQIYLKLQTSTGLFDSAMMHDFCCHLQFYTISHDNFTDLERLIARLLLLFVVSLQNLMSFVDSICIAAWKHWKFACQNGSSWNCSSFPKLPSLLVLRAICVLWYQIIIDSLLVFDFEPATLVCLFGGSSYVCFAILFSFTFVTLPNTL